MSGEFDQAKLEALVGKVIGDVAGAMGVFMGYLGDQAGQKRLTEILNEAGFTKVRRAAETPTNMVLEVRA